MIKKGFAPLVIIIAILAALIVAGGVLYYAKTKATEPSGIACTMEAMLCPDGSYVARTGPHCEFSACPQPSPTPTPRPGGDCKGPGDSSCGAGYTCIQKCGPPLARENDPPPGYYCETYAVAKQPRMCPICLASNTNIATPGGDVNVKDLTVGMTVWSLDKSGQKVASTVRRVAHTTVPKTHTVIHLVLVDGREVWVSPLHPTTTGARVQDLAVGDVYDGARIVTAATVPYWDAATYDLLPDSATGFYWANGILLGSTLK